MRRSAAAGTPRPCSPPEPRSSASIATRAAIAAAQARLAGSERFSAIEGRAGELESLLGPLGVLPLDGLLMDLGVSSPQLDTPERGFSFQTDGPLDMRMGDSGETAAELIARLSEAELAVALRELGEEPFARPIARALKQDLPGDDGGRGRGGEARACRARRGRRRSTWPRAPSRRCASR